VTEAVQLVTGHAFTPVGSGGLGRNRLQIGTAWSNTASRRVAERAGFTLAARYRQDGIVGVGAEQRLDDGAWYEALAEEITPRRG
jgi:RimJ/RimL family protein N-acetyltransferase